jgi:hypothetical protein
MPPDREVEAEAESVPVEALPQLLQLVAHQRLGDEMKALLEEAMKDGALGLSTYMMMPPGSLASARMRTRR